MSPTPQRTPDVIDFVTSGYVLNARSYPLQTPPITDICSCVPCIIFLLGALFCDLAILRGELCSREENQLKSVLEDAWLLNVLVCGATKASVIRERHPPKIKI
jgi:hypothetical protein